MKSPNVRIVKVIPQKECFRRILQWDPKAENPSVLVLLKSIQIQTEEPSIEMQRLRAFQARHWWPMHTDLAAFAYDWARLMEWYVHQSVPISQSMHPTLNFLYQTLPPEDIVHWRMYREFGAIALKETWRYGAKLELVQEDLERFEPHRSYRLMRPNEIL